MSETNTDSDSDYPFYDSECKFDEIIDSEIIMKHEECTDPIDQYGIKTHNIAMTKNGKIIYYYHYGGDISNPERYDDIVIANNFRELHIPKKIKKLFNEKRKKLIKFAKLL